MTTEQQIFENSNYNYVWRNTDYEWLYELLTNKQIKSEKGRFISFSLEEDGGGMDDFGGTRIKFNRNLLDKQGLIEIFYESDFFEKYSEICLYVTAYESEQHYYDNNDCEDADEKGVLSWEQYIEDYEHEQELVLKNLIYTEKLIEEVIFLKDVPSKELINILKNKNIKFDIS